MSDRVPRPLRVLQLLADPALQGTRPVDNPYTSLLVDSLPADRVQTLYPRWRRLLAQRFDVLHVHWPENSLRHRSLLGRLVKRTMFAAFLLRLRLQRKAVVRTVHNISPHEGGGRVERWLLGALERRTTLWVVLNETTPTPDPGRTVLVRHGHYRGWYAPSAEGAPVAGRLLNFGMIRRYKGADDLVRAFRATGDEHLTLHVIGDPGDAATAERLADVAGGDPRIVLDLRFVSEQVLADEIAAAEAVVLPYQAMHNSGALLLALSLARPVIVPSSETTELWAEEFGAEWVATYRGPLDAETLLRMLARIRAAVRADTGPDLRLREWPALAELLAEAYERAYRVAAASPSQVTGGGPATT